jgi:NADH-quinone oxidoreductase subunit H
MTIDNIIMWFQSWMPNVNVALLFFVATLIAALVIFMIMAINALVAVYAERKISAFMQDRVGPMGQGPGLHAGKWGLLQTVADTIKLILKEDIIPKAADKKLFIIAPFVIFLGAFIALAAIPWGPTFIAADMNIGLFYILAVSSFGVIGIILAAWSSDNKWSLFGGMRSAAQIISYEIPAALSLVTVLLLAGTLSMQDIVGNQSDRHTQFLDAWRGQSGTLQVRSGFRYINPDLLSILLGQS